MKIPFLDIWITRTDWEAEYWELYDNSNANHETFWGIISDLKSQLAKQSETYTGKDGRLRYKQNGQFAPDDRTKFKKVHDQLMQEVSKPVGHYDAFKKAGK